MATEAGLGERLEAIGRLHRVSGRLSRTSKWSRGAFAGDNPRLPESLAWPEAEGHRLAFVLCLDLTTLGELGDSPPGLPRQGSAWIFAPADSKSSRPVCLLTSEEAEPFRAESSTPLRLSAELQLPRAWSTAVEGLGLSDAERSAWQLLRTQLAERQGVAAIDGGPAPAPIHRLLGYPDERRGDMPLQCELRARGLEQEGLAPREHPGAAELEPASRRWWLLAQLDTDAELGWSWGARRRLYLWAAAVEPGAPDHIEVVGLAR